MAFKREDFKQALDKLRESSVKRNFDQSVDMIINLKDLDIKKNDQKVDLFVKLPYQPKPNVKVCAFVDQQDYDSAKENADFVIDVSEFGKYKDKKLAKKLASKYDFFIASVPIMPKVASIFGRILGSRGKMPNPKIGGVFPPGIPLKPIVEGLKRTVRLRTKSGLILQTIIGKESYDDEKLLENLDTVYSRLVSSLPNNENNVKNIYLKLTMGKPVKVK